MATEEQLKERALFYMDRRISTLVGEDVHADHEQMASVGMSYAERQRAEASLEQKKEKDRNELEAMQWARDKLMEVK